MKTLEEMAEDDGYHHFDLSERASMELEGPDIRIEDEEFRCVFLTLMEARALARWIMERTKAEAAP